MQNRERKSIIQEDGILLLLGAFCIAVGLYHPFYFGDELFSFAFGAHNEGRFIGTFNELNSYKPRVLMNIIWAMIVAQEWPRWVPMAINASALGASAWVVYAISIRVFNASRPAALIGGLLVLISRFNIMLYYDYVSGTVESLSLLFFLVGFLLSANAVLNGATLSWRRWVFAIAFFTATVLVHERYVAGIAGLFGFSLLARMPFILRQRDWRSVIMPCICVVATGLIVVALVKALSNNSVTMGTSGRVVTVNGETLHVARTYLQNLFLGANYGPDWFVGLINQGNPMSGKIFRGAALIFALAWIVPFFYRERAGSAIGARARMLQQALPLVGFILGMVAVASLPGADRQEARWMYPAMTFVILLIHCLYAGFGRYFLLALLVLTQVFYIRYGSLDRIASINGSETALRIGRAMDSVDFPGNAGIMISVPEPDTSWIIGGSDGSVFCSVNLSAKNCVMSRGRPGTPLQGAYGFGLVPQGLNRRGDWTYRYVPKGEVDMLLNPDAVPAGGRILGKSADWEGWVVARPELVTAAGLVLPGLSENFLRMEAADMDGRILVYKAVAIDGANNVPMRLQINWHDSNNSFLGAAIEVVEVGTKEREYVTRVTAPDKASYGYVYATLHANDKGSVILAEVRLVTL